MITQTSCHFSFSKKKKKKSCHFALVVYLSRTTAPPQKLQMEKLNKPLLEVQNMHTTI